MLVGYECKALLEIDMSGMPVQLTQQHFVLAFCKGLACSRLTEAAVLGKVCLQVFAANTVSVISLVKGVQATSPLSNPAVLCTLLNTSDVHSASYLPTLQALWSHLRGLMQPRRMSLTLLQPTQQNCQHPQRAQS